VGRKTKRTLPNGVVTTYEYNWRDQLTNIVHKTSGGTTLASASYERAPFGEPTKIIREGGSNYVTLKYDSALRLTNEVHFINGVNGSGGTQADNIGYGYDVAGNRVALLTGGVTYTNAVSQGYRITAVKNGAATNEAYSYDNGGRVISMTRGSTRTFGYNSSDQLAAVTNGATWTTYSHDAQGRRTKSADSTGAQRRFLVAGTSATDLESPQLIADSTNGLKQGYVFIGDDPILRYDDAGNRVYYLEDAMGSVIGLAPHSSPGTANTTKLFYDGFGKTRMTNGPAPSLPTGTGGDFRFHGAWWESATDLYHMRAREYDQRLGRFLSRDPDEGAFSEPESLNPYAYAYNNGLIYTDPTGEFTMIEISLTTALQFTLQTIRTVGVNEAKRYAIDKITELFARAVIEQMGAFIPGFDFSKFQQYFSANPVGVGRAFDRAVRFAFCEIIGRGKLGNKIHYGVRVVDRGPRLGDPISAGRNCNKENKSVLGQTRGASYSVPDFIFGPAPLVPPGGKSGMQKTAFIAEVKSHASTMYGEYISPGRKSEQLDAILAYSGKHTETHIAMFVIAQNDLRTGVKEKAQFYLMRRQIGGRALSKGVISVLVKIR
jgi:RHS repeat-associated protein